MGLTSIVGIGIVLVLVVLIKKNTMMEWVGNHWIVRKLSKQRWFKNKWLSGLFLFFLNAVLFFLATAFIVLSSYILIPYLHVAFMFAATIASIYLWIAVRRSGNKGRTEQRIMGFAGSSFYMILFFVFLYLFLTLEPPTPEHDPFMAAIGLMFGMIVSFVAWLTCFLITGGGSGKHRFINNVMKK